MGEARVVLGVEVIGPAGDPGRQWGELSTMLTQALDTGGILPDDVVDYEEVGDGARYVLPIGRLAPVVGLAEHIDTAATRHNRWRTPALRVKIAVDLGQDTGTLDRLLGTTVVDRCVAANPSVHSGLLLSDRAFRTVFDDDCPLPKADFAHVDQLWVRVPGVAADEIEEFGPEPEADTRQAMNITNTISGNAQNVIQAGVVHGGVHWGQHR